MRLKETVLILSIVLFAGLIRIPSLTQPIGPDQSIMSVIGKGILEGELPYRDYWEMGTPAIFYTYPLMFKVFGTSMTAIPITDTLASMLTTFLIFLLAAKIWDKRVGSVSAALFAFFSNGVRLGMHAGGDTAFGTFWYMAQRETFILPLMVAALYLIIGTGGEKRDTIKLLAAGLFSGMAFVYKFPALMVFACVVLYLNWGLLKGKRPLPWKRLAAGNLVLLSGFVLALAPFALLFAAKGALGDMVDVIFKYVFSVYGQIERNYPAILKMGLVKTHFVATESFILWVFGLASGIYILRKERSRENLLVLAWAIASFLFIISHREFFGYQYLFVLPALSVLAGYGFVQALGPSLNIKRMVTAEFGKVFIIFALLGNLVIFATLNFMHYTKFYYYVTEKISQEEYYDFFNAYPDHDYSFPADFKVARYIKDHTVSDDRIFVMGGIEGGIYLLSERKSASRFVFSWFLFSPVFGQVAQAAEYRAELLSDLKTKTPRYIVTIRPLESFESYRDIHDFVDRNYALEREFPDDRFLYALNVR
jgi:hypothetical protein